MLLDPQDYLRALADQTRLRMLVLLHQNPELCVCELTHALGTVQPKISRHLAILRKLGVLLDRRQGQWIYYRINADLPDWATRALNAIVDGAAQRPPFTSDAQSLATMGDRPD